MDLAAPEGLARELRGIESPGRDPPAGGARRLFENPGFQIDALPADWAIDRHGKTQDLVLMSYDVSAFHD